MMVLEKIASNSWQDQQKTVEVIRNGEQQVISSFDLVVWRSFASL
jgi:sarcosine oxidase gamma subunit